MGEDRVFFFDDDGTQRSLPSAWTDAVEADAFVALAGGRSAFRVEDLLVMVELIDGLRRPSGCGCKENSAATERRIVPLAPGVIP